VTEIDRAAVSAGLGERLDRIIRLLSAMVTRDMDKKESVLALTAAGLAPKEIGDILALTRNQVSVILYEAKQAATKQTKNPKAAQTKAQPRGG